MSDADRSPPAPGAAHYTYEYGGESYEATHTFVAYDKVRAPYFEPGRTVWVVVSPQNQARSIPWV